MAIFGQGRVADKEQGCFEPILSLERPITVAHGDQPKIESEGEEEYITIAVESFNSQPGEVETKQCNCVPSSVV